jgi:hypothetical protein
VKSRWIVVAAGAALGVPVALGLLQSQAAEQKAAGPAVVAFPGAEGAGRWAKGGRGGRVFEVNSLEDSGTGTLRDAVESRGPRTVVFRVGGTIDLDDDLVVRDPFLTIAGQTAPGDGITLRGGSLVIAAGEVIVRYLRVRYGDQTNEDNDAVTVSGPGENIIVDHCSASWSIDETLSVTGDRWDKVSVQWCIISEGLDCSHHKKGCHGYGSLIRGCCGHKVAYHHNLYAHFRTRMPRPGDYKGITLDPAGIYFDFRNNVVYDWLAANPGYDADTDAVANMNFIGNSYVRGPKSPSRIAFNNSSKEAHAYFAGNTMDGAVPPDPWSLVTTDRSVNPASFRLTTPVPLEPVTTEEAPTAFARVLKEAGATIPRRDPVDHRIVADVEKRTGKIINSQDEVGGWPKLATGAPPPDTDHDGLPDAWETSHKLNPRDPADGPRDRDGDGYTNLEEYLDCLAGACPPSKTPAAAARAKEK